MTSLSQPKSILPEAEWRVPTRAELLSIVDFDRTLGTGSGAISPGFTLPVSSTISSVVFWTSTPVADGTMTNYWIVNFVDGRLNTTDASNTTKNYVRCVRQDLN